MVIFSLWFFFHGFHFHFSIRFFFSTNVCVHFISFICLKVQFSKRRFYTPGQPSYLNYEESFWFAPYSDPPFHIMIIYGQIRVDYNCSWNWLLNYFAFMHLCAALRKSNSKRVYSILWKCRVLTSIHTYHTACQVLKTKFVYVITTPRYIILYLLTTKHNGYEICGWTNGNEYFIRFINWKYTICSII